MKKIVLKVNNHAKDPIVHTKLQSSITPRKKRNSKKSFYFWILRWTSFLMIPLTFLYDEYIDRPKFTEQKKKPIWVYSSFPHKWGRNKNLGECYKWLRVSTLKMNVVASECWANSRSVFWKEEKICCTSRKTFGISISEIWVFAAKVNAMKYLRELQHLDSPIFCAICFLK